MGKPNRAKVELRRRREQETARAREAQAAQAAAEARRALQQRKRRKVMAWVLFALAPVVVVTHVLEHVGVFQLYAPPLEDLTIGYPTAFILVIAGGILLGTD